MAIDFNQNFFELFELECSVDINSEILEKKYLNFQKKFHPDKFVNASDHEKRLSLQITSYVNEAYKILKNDYLKSMYLLKIKGYDIDNQNNTISDPDFLMHQMELREESDEIISKKNVNLKKDFFIKLNVLKKKFQDDFKIKYESGLFEEASDSIKKMKFYISIENDLKRNG
ncbi:Fe-S protein assembly co-chaperone HscB [Gammaproteobacteria bacterium]|nr:Fe-S protein assembly co-chaperone HscB [Gammaproteobacteria bacterium]